MAVAREQMFDFAYGRGRKAEIYLLVQGKANMRVPSAAAVSLVGVCSQEHFLPKYYCTHEA